MKYRLSPTGAYPSKASFAASSASSSGVRLMRPSAVGENCATPPRRSNTTSLTLLGKRSSATRLSTTLPTAICPSMGWLPASALMM